MKMKIKFVYRHNFAELAKMSAKKGGFVEWSPKMQGSWKLPKNGEAFPEVAKMNPWSGFYKKAVVPKDQLFAKCP
jgi:hypothetical protein